MGQTVGKQVDRVNDTPIIGELSQSDDTEFYTNPIDFIHQRFKVRESISQWGFLWAHRILEEVFVRPELDMKWILNHLNKEDLARIIPKSEFDNISLSYDSSKADKLKELQQLLASTQGKQEETSSDEEFLRCKMTGMLEIAQRISRYIWFHTFGANAIDVLVESDWYFEFLKEQEVKIRRLKKDIADKLFQKKLQDIKTKFSAILRIFDKVINGKDSFDTRKKRIDSLFYHWEEIAVFITDVESIIYEKAHCWIDFVSNFLVFHLGMLQIAEENFGLKDYFERRTNWLKFYPILMRSYIDKATSNYVRAIILNYHNQYSQFQESEEIFNEMTGGVIYHISRSEFHLIWNKSNLKEMENDNMYYQFNEQKLVTVNPSFLWSLETPLLWRALRYGVASKLEDLFSDYINNINLWIGLLGRTNIKKGFDTFDFTNLNESFELNQSSSTICSSTDEDLVLSSSQKYHEQRIAKLDQLQKESEQSKELAHTELNNLERIFKSSVTDIIKSKSISSETEKLSLISSFISKLKDSEKLILNMNKYLCFSWENKRYFKVSF